MTQNPYVSDDFQKASEYLRLAVALLAKHKIPPSPFFYRLGYDIVAEGDTELSAAFEQTASASAEPSLDGFWALYQKHFVHDDETLDALRQEMRRIIVYAQEELQAFDGNFSKYSKTLKELGDILHPSIPPQILVNQVRKTIDGSQGMESATQRLESQLPAILSEVDALRKQLEQVREESLTDALTGIANRKAFDTALEPITLTASKQKTPFCLLMADIDRFKQFNDLHGHLVGDKVLRFFAATFKRTLKGKDMVARFGGEEFASILPNTDLQGAASVAEQIRVAISSGQLKDTASDKYYGRLTASIGVAEFNFNEHPNDLIQRVDQALYRAKHLGRNRVENAI